MHLCSIFQALQNTRPAMNGANYKIIKYSDYTTDDPGMGNTFFSSAFRPALAPTQNLIYRYRGLFPWR